MRTTEVLRGALSSVAVPTLVVCGTTTCALPLPVAEDLHRAIPGSTLVVIPGAGHVCNIDAPEAFDNAVRTLLRRVDP